MYESFYGFSEKPFSLLPDPGFLYESSKHRMAATMLEYGLMNMAGITVITGEVGAGKTTLIRHLLNTIDSNTTVGLISNTHKSFGELLQWVHMAFGLEYRGKDKVELYHDFEQFIVKEYAKGNRTVLIIDEAQNMAPETLEELRMLSNINADKDQVLQLVLVGQPELRATLNRTDLRQFAQRISSSYHLEALSMAETRGYIRHRLKTAGGNIDLFKDEACEEVWRCSRGVPRLINTLCDTALVYGFAEQISSIDAELVRDVAREKASTGLFSATLGGSNDETTTAVMPDRVNEQKPAPVASIEKPVQSGEVIRYSFQKKSTKKVRVAVASESQEHMKLLKAMIEEGGMSVTVLSQIREQSLLEINSEQADVLLVDLDDSMEMIPGHLDYLFDNLLNKCQLPVLFNDGDTLDDDIENNKDFGRILITKLGSLVGSQKVV